MKTFRQLMEDSQHSGYPTTLETPRELGQKDYDLVSINIDRKPGEKLLDVNGNEVEGSSILQNNEAILQYAHSEENELHIESVEIYRSLWNSIHIPKQSIKYLR